MVPVILFHGGFDVFSGGFVGVDVFFVISGYLITTILLKDIEQGKLSIVNFYERRARRILPALFLVMFACLPFAWLWLFPSDMKDFAESLVAVSAFTSNILFWRESGYFDTVAELKPLLHTWSLAVEEQYYVLFPLFLMITGKLRLRWVLAMLVVVAFVSLALAHWGSIAKPAAAFYLLPTRGWELLIGAFVAFYLSSNNRVPVSRTVQELGGLIGLLLLLYGIFAFDKTTPFPSLYTIVPTFGTALIIIYASQNSFVGRFLGLQVLVGVGLISYSAYLWHQPLFAFARLRSLSEPSQAVFSMLAASSLVLAYFSWKFVEAPFRKECLINRRVVFLSAAVCSLLFIAIGLIGYTLEGKVGKVASDGRYADLTYRLRANFGLDRACDSKVLDTEECKTANEPEVLLWGDSYAMHLAQGFLASNGSIKIMQTTVSECAPVLGLAPASSMYGAQNCIDGNDLVINLIRHSRSIKFVVLSSPSFLLGHSKIATRDGVRELSDEEIEAHFITTLERISSLGATPVVFSPPPRNGDDIGRCLLKAEIRNYSRELCNFHYSKVEEEQQRVFKMLRNISNTYKVVWLADGLCRENICMTYSDDILFYRDSGHLSYEGSAQLGKEMDFYRQLFAPISN